MKVHHPQRLKPRLGIIGTGYLRLFFSSFSTHQAPLPLPLIINNFIQLKSKNTRAVTILSKMPIIRAFSFFFHKIYYFYSDLVDSPPRLPAPPSPVIDVGAA